jgi:hypothetical protein
MRGRVAVAVAALAVSAGGCGEPEQAGRTTPDEAPLTLQLPTTGSGRCGAPQVSVLARADHAFDGTVETVTGTDVSLEVDRWFAGDDGGLVLVTTVRGAQATERFPDFQAGERYLVAAAGTEILVCGYTDRWSRALDDLYQQAFEETD